MKKFAVLAGFALLAACGSKQEAATDAAASDSTAASAAATPAAVYAPGAGSYDVTPPGEPMHVTTMIADGAYVQRDTKGKVMEKGKWADRDGKTCFAPEKGAEECYVLSTPGADGGFTATDAKGAVFQVKTHAK
jgi:hypothetical protein